MKHGENVLAAIFEEILGPLVSWAVILILVGVAVAAVYLWIAVFVA